MDTTTPSADNLLRVLAACKQLGVTRLTRDSRCADSQSGFVAIKGSTHDGKDFAQHACANGAKLLIGGVDCVDVFSQLPAQSCVVDNDNVAQIFAQASAKLCEPAPEWLAAVTGTNGKTSIAWFARQLMRACGLRSASLGTLGVNTTDRLCAQFGLTTGDPFALAEDLSKLAAENVTHAVLEASSHGLAQHRLSGYTFDCVVLAQLGRDHLDYHQTLSRYYGAKATLFTQRRKPNSIGIIRFADSDEPHEARLLRQDCVAQVGSDGATGVSVTYGPKNGEPLSAQLVLTISEFHPSTNGHCDITIAVSGQNLPTRHTQVTLPLTGQIQAENVLAAVAITASALLSPIETASARILSDLVMQVLPQVHVLTAVPGRLERIGNDSRLVYVDFAHTPDALAAAIEAIRPHVSGKLTVVFGAGGDRDQGKRPQMGETVAALADRAVVTDDNPRSEQPETIRKAIMAAIPWAQEIGNRAQAIAAAIAQSQAGDAVLIAGKGHENTQTINGVTYEFSDQRVARDCLRA